MASAHHEQRIAAVLTALEGASSIIDLGCGDGDLLLRLIALPHVRHVTGVEISAPAVERLRAKLAALPEEQRAKARLVHGSMIAPPDLRETFDAAVMLETIEHVPPEQLSLVERTVLVRLRPPLAVITTPNADYNPVLGVPAHRFRHPEHRFEWGRTKFRNWAEGAARRTGYAVAFSDMAGDHPTLGGPSQMAAFTRPLQPATAT